MQNFVAYLTAAYRFTPARRGWIIVWIALWLLAGCGQGAQPPGTTAIPPEASPQAAAEATKRVTAAVIQVTRTPEAEGSSLPSPTRSIAISPSALKGQVIQFWHPYTDESQVLLDLMVQEFNRTNEWGIRVENVSQPGFGVLQTQLRAAVEAGEIPDVWTVLPYQALQLDASGQTVADLTPYINDPEYGLDADAQQDFLPGLWRQEHIPSPALKGRPDPQGKRLGLPWVRNGILFLYNRTWAQELGFSVPPETPTGFRDQACAAARANSADRDRQNDGTGGWMVSGDPAELSGWLDAFGAEIIRQDGRGYQFDTPEAHQALEYLMQLSSQGCLWLAGDPDPTAALIERRAIFKVINLVDLPSVREALDQAEAADTWQVLPFPSPLDQPAVVSYGLSFILAQSTPERQLAGWLFMRWMDSPGNQARWAQFNYLLPTRLSALDALQTAGVQNQDWVKALEYLAYLQPEPYYVSWQRVRWSLGDALTQLVSPQPQPVQVGELLRMLDELAAEVHLQIR